METSTGAEKRSVLAGLRFWSISGVGGALEQVRCVNSPFEHFLLLLVKEIGF
jgi:hypothetical protein